MRSAPTRPPRGKSLNNMVLPKAPPRKRNKHARYNIAHFDAHTSSSTENSAIIYTNGKKGEKSCMSTYEPVEQSPIKVYYLTSDLDEELCHKLMQHLKIFERTNRMTGWHPGELLPGDTSTTGRTLHLEEAQLILLLISPDFIASDEIYTHDMQIALEHHASGKAYAVPILLRPGSYKDAPFAHLKVLPDNAVALSIWSNEDTAYANIANGIDRI